MSTVDGQSAPGASPSSDPADLKLEAVVIPVADADRSKAFYAGLGWRLDADFSFDNGFRIVQFTPPGSQCSVQFGTHDHRGATRICPWPVPDRVRHRCRARRAYQPGRQGQ